jgi:hypothetical protein
MWDEIVKNLADHSSAVLSGVDGNGYPFSIRCRPVPDQTWQALRMEDPAPHPIRPGPASLLCHAHDDDLWNLRTFNVRGRLEQDGDGWLFHAERVISGGASDSLSGLWQARGRAGRYLKKRGLARPAIPWDDYKAIWKEVKESS